MTPGTRRRYPVGPARLLVAGGGCLAISVLGAAFLPGVNGSHAVLAGAATASAGACARLESHGHRLDTFNLFVWALFVRVLVTIACYVLAVREGGPFLGPDSTTYFRLSADLAASGFRLDTHPVVTFGSYDVAQYYLFAYAIRYAGADLFGLQIMNGSLVALAVALSYGAARRLWPGGAWFVAIGSAFHPSLIVVSAVDLLKDPSIILGTVLLIWAVVRVAATRRIGLMLVLAGLAIAAALYLRTGRFYAFAYIEFGTLGAGAFFLALRRRALARRAAFVVLIAIFLTAEAVPFRWGWPPAPVMVLDTVAYALGAPGLRHYALGFFDRIQQPSSERRERPAVESAGGVGRLLTIPANLVRRIYGPFVWIAPEDWSFRALQAGDYLLYPGMLVWYAIVPLVFVGLLLVGRQFAIRQPPDFGLAAVWLFVLLYFGQYLSINLSYRQRDVMLPLLLVFAGIGAERLRAAHTWRRWYAAYWAVLVVMAVAHLALRAAFSGD